ncbi:hypothetical protein TNCV_1319001 [Trichonephila clavipes]|nr:hypothetical protein TNCV_1319001 [Trichonephila clavipes]
MDLQIFFCRRGHPAGRHRPLGVHIDHFGNHCSKVSGKYWSIFIVQIVLWLIREDDLLPIGKLLPIFISIVTGDIGVLRQINIARKNPCSQRALTNYGDRQGNTCRYSPMCHVNGRLTAWANCARGPGPPLQQGPRLVLDSALIRNEPNMKNISYPGETHGCLDGVFSKNPLTSYIVILVDFFSNFPKNPYGHELANIIAKNDATNMALSPRFRQISIELPL